MLFKSPNIWYFVMETPHIKRDWGEVVAVVKQLRAWIVLPKDPGSTPSTHMSAHNCL